MADTITLLNGVQLTIEEAEIFCSLPPSTTPANIQMQCDAARQLRSHFRSKNNFTKSKKYHHQVEGIPEKDGIDFSIYDLFSLYTFPRLFIGSLGRFMSILGHAFLPMWFPLLGLSYFIQAPIAFKDGEYEKGIYWTIWAAFNTLGCLAVYGAAIGLSGGTFALASLIIGAYSYLFDIKFEGYKYLTETKAHESLLAKLSQNNKYLDANQQYTDNHFVDELQKKTNEIQAAREESARVWTTVMIGAGLVIASSVFPPLFFGEAIVGAAIALTAITYIVIKKAIQSWNDPHGVLMHCARKPLNHLLEYIDDHLTHTLHHKHTSANLSQSHELPSYTVIRNGLSRSPSPVSISISPISRSDSFVYHSGQSPVSPISPKDHGLFKVTKQNDLPPAVALPRPFAHN